MKIKVTENRIFASFPYKTGCVQFSRPVSNPHWRLDKMSDPKFSPAKVTRMFGSALTGSRAKNLITKQKNAKHQYYLDIKF